MNDLIIFGAGGLGREAAFLAKRMSAFTKAWNLLGFVDDTVSLAGKMVDGLPVLGPKTYFEHHQEPVYVVCALGEPQSKQAVVRQLSKYSNIQWATLIDPQAVISPDVRVGEGSMIFANTTITVNVTIGAHVLIYYNVSVAHDVTIRDYASINHGVNISGNVSIGTCGRMGVGSKVIEKITIADDSMVGAGAVVIHDVPKGQTVVGVPAQRLVKRKDL